MVKFSIGQLRLTVSTLVTRQTPKTHLSLRRPPNTTFAADEVVGMWVFNPYVNSSSRTINQATYGGVQIVFGTGSGSANTALYRIDGADVAGVGGWKYYVVDPSR